MTRRTITPPALGDFSRPLLHLMLQASGLPESRWADLLAGVHPDLPAQYRQYAARIELTQFLDVAEQLMQCSPAGERLGLAIGNCLRDTDLGLAGQIARTAPTLRQALNSLTHYSPLMARCYLIQPRLLPGEPAGLRFQSPTRTRQQQFLNEGAVAIFARLIEQLSGRRHALSGATLAAADAGELAAMSRHLGVTVRSSPQYSTLLLHTEALDWPVLTAEPALHAELCQLGDRQLQALQQDETISGRVQLWLGPRLQGQAPNLEDAAAALGMPAWTLRRRLQMEHTSYRILLDKMRQQLSVSHLGDNRLSLGEVAWILGFSSSGAFQRAFKRWTGDTPGRYREQACLLRTATR